MMARQRGEGSLIDQGLADPALGYPAQPYPPKPATPAPAAPPPAPVALHTPSGMHAPSGMHSAPSGGGVGVSGAYEAQLLAMINDLYKRVDQEQIDKYREPVVNALTSQTRLSSIGGRRRPARQRTYLTPNTGGTA